MALKFFISLSTQIHHPNYNNQQIHHPPKTLPNIPSINPNSPFLSQTQNFPLVTSRRKLLNISILNGLLINGSTLLLQGVLSDASLALEQQPVYNLVRYTDTEQGFSLLIPTSYVKVDKAGATVLFEEPNKGSTNNVGVVVSPVRLASLGEFGTPQFVADKLLQAERRKESTKEAEVVGVGERAGDGGLQVYEIEYRLDSTRGGVKRVFSAAFVASRKLYLLNIVHSDKEESPLDGETREVLERVLHSFNTASMA